MKLLIIEDNIDSVKRIIDYAKDEQWCLTSCDFDEASDHIKNYEPDIVVMDWMFDAEEIQKGKGLLNLIWSHDFCPVIIYSAIADTINLEDEQLRNPLIAKLPKGDEEKVVDILNQWCPFIPLIHKLRAEFNKAMISSLEAVKTFNDSPPTDDLFMYMLGKRAANHFNNRLFTTDLLPAWIQYIYPPMSQDLFVGDILRKISQEQDLTIPGFPEEYRVILSPSCDMANRDEIMVLTALCEAPERFTNNEHLSGEQQLTRKDVEKIDKYSKQLNQGYNNALVALPVLNGIIPYMTVNLKRLNYDISKINIATSYEEIQESHTYFRVASMDSPFREQFVWAHMLNSCRPGVPARDTSEWAKGVLSL